MSYTSQTNRFYQDPDGRWYIDLPEYIEAGLGNKSNLEMVAGADDLLTNLAAGKSEIVITFSDQPFEGYTVQLERSSDYGYDPPLDMEEDAGGQYHVVQKTKWYQKKPEFQFVWLCPVTLYVFNGEYPKNIYIKVN
jgi:hypothetical protein